MAILGNCPNCGGRGKITRTGKRSSRHTSECYFCNGSGRVTREQRQDFLARNGGQPRVKSFWD